MINPRIFRQYDIRGLVNRDLNENTIFEHNTGMNIE